MSEELPSDAYVAGFVDGEGSIGLYRSKGSADSRYRSGRRPPCWVRGVRIASTHHPTLDDILQAYRLGTIRRLQLRGTHKPQYEWSVNSKADIKTFLGKILPLMREKREQARVLLAEIDGLISTEKAAEFLKKAKAVRS